MALVEIKESHPRTVCASCSEVKCGKHRILAAIQDECLPIRSGRSTHNITLFVDPLKSFYNTLFERYTMLLSEFSDGSDTLFVLVDAIR